MGEEQKPEGRPTRQARGGEVVGYNKQTNKLVDIARGVSLQRRDSGCFGSLEHCYEIFVA